MISGFRREVDGNFALLGYYAASSGNCLPTFLLGFLILEDGTGSLYRNVGKKNYHYALRNNPEERSSHEVTYLSSHSVSG